MLLPTPVADELKTGIGSKPTEYEHTTIYQSDIQGFTSIGKRSTPLQIMEMLGDIYIVFDKLLSQHDAYKVETIGDAYVAISGALNNNSRHASEICGFAVKVRDKIDNFVIRHLPNEKLKVRIGVHRKEFCT